MEKISKPYQTCLIIPSWGRLLGYVTLGSYSNRQIKNVDKDFVVFLTSETSIVHSETHTVVYVFGLGLYFTKFEIEKGKYIIDTRRLSCLALSDFVYNYAIQSKDITLESDPNIILKEDLIVLPLGLPYTSDPHLSFLKGILTRYVFTPYKDIFINFFERLQNGSEYNLDRMGHAILSTHPQFYDFLIYARRLPEQQKAVYGQATASIKSVYEGAEQFLGMKFSAEEIAQFDNGVYEYERFFKQLQFDPMYPFSLLENCEQTLSSLNQSMSTQAYLEIPLAPWPVEFPRQTLEFWGIQKPTTTPPPTALVDRQTAKKKDENLPDLQGYIRGPTEDGEKYTPPALSHPEISPSPLPDIPEGDLTAIFATLLEIIQGPHDMPQIGEAFDIARDKIQQIQKYGDFIWEIGKIANIYRRQQKNLGLSLKEQNDIMIKLQMWIYKIQQQQADLEAEAIRAMEAEEKHIQEKKHVVKVAAETKKKLAYPVVESPQPSTVSLSKQELKANLRRMKLEEKQKLRESKARLKAEKRKAKEEERRIKNETKRKMKEAKRGN